MCSKVLPDPNDGRETCHTPTTQQDDIPFMIILSVCFVSHLSQKVDKDREVLYSSESALQGLDDNRSHRTLSSTKIMDFQL